MSDVATNIEIQIAKCMRAIPHAKIRAEAEALQDEIAELELERDNACPACGDYEVDETDNDKCGDDYHSKT